MLDLDSFDGIDGAVSNVYVGIELMNLFFFISSRKYVYKNLYAQVMDYLPLEALSEIAVCGQLLESPLHPYMLSKFPVVQLQNCVTFLGCVLFDKISSQLQCLFDVVMLDYTDPILINQVIKDCQTQRHNTPSSTFVPTKRLNSSE